MSKPKVRTGIVGAGFAASFHIEAARRAHGADVNVIGVHARTDASTDSFAAKHGIKAFAELDALLEQIDVLHVCIPPALHEPVAVQALQRGIFPIVEKPLTGYFGDGAPDFDGREASMTQWGPADFGFSRGEPSLMHTDGIRPFEEQVIKKSIEFGVAPRIEIAEPEQAKRYIDLGVRHFCIGWDRFILQAGLARIGEGMRKVLETV